MTVTEIVQSHRTRCDMLRAWAEHDVQTYRAFGETMERFGINVRTADVLDLGCGSNAPMSLMLHAGGARVTGVDHYLGHRWGLGFKPSRYWQYARDAGPLKAARKAVGEWVYDRRYFEHLSASIGLPLTEIGLDLRTMEAGRLSFCDASFDVVHSNATWEHLAHVYQANCEVSRVLRPGGLAYIEIHLFPSLSGGHDLPWIVPGRIELRGCQPWRHLLDPQWQAAVYLNRLRERDYLKLFKETPGLEVVDWISEFVEGTELLTDDILRRVPRLSAADLTRRSVVAVLKRVA